MRRNPPSRVRYVEPKRHTCRRALRVFPTVLALTGRLSLVLDGQIEQDLEPEQLRYRLEALMLHRTKRPAAAA